MIILTVNSEIFARFLFSFITLKYIYVFAKLKIHDWGLIYLHQISSISEVLLSQKFACARFHDNKTLTKFLNLQYSKDFNKCIIIIIKGAQWLSGRVLDSRPRGHGFVPQRRHCVVVLEQGTFILA